jgi:hypothetical protein
MRGSGAEVAGQITLLANHAVIFGLCGRQGSTMLFLAIIARLAAPREARPNDLLVRSRLGHLGLTIIALVYVLLSWWQR